MKKSGKVVIASDLGQESAQAIATGISWAFNLNLEAEVFHVIDDFERSILLPLDVRDAMKDHLKTVEKNYLKELQQQLTTQKDNVKNGKQVPVRIVQIFGSPIEELSKKSASAETEITVLAAQGHSALEDMLFGSITEKMMKRFPGTLLITRGEDFATHPKKIMVLLGQDELMKITWAWAKKLARAFGAHLNLVHSIEVDVSRYLHEGAEFTKMNNLEDLLEEEKRAVNKTLEQMIEEVSADNKISAEKFVLFSPDFNTYESIEKIVTEQKPDLVILGTHHRKGLKKFFLGNLAESIFSNTQAAIFLPHDFPL